MALTPIQRELIESTLGVQPRRKGLHIASKTEKADSKIVGALDDYTRREEKVLEAVKALESVPATGHLVVDLEQRVSLIRKSVREAGRDEAAQVITKAYEDLDTIKDEARRAATLAEGHKDFYGLLDNAGRDLQTLENHAHHAYIGDRISTIDSALQDARKHAKDGKFDLAEASLQTATNISREAKRTADKYAVDLKAFNDRAAEIEVKLNALKAHVQHAHVAPEILEADTKLGQARAKAIKGDFGPADTLLDEVEKACDDGKGFADRYALFIPKRAEAMRMVNGMRGIFKQLGDGSGNDMIQTAADAIVLATAKADTPTRQYDAAETDLANLRQPIQDKMTQWYVTNNKTKIATLEGKETALKAKLANDEKFTVIAEMLTQIKQLQDSLDSDIAAGRWTQAVMTGRQQLNNMINSALKIVARREEYEVQRVTTVSAIDALDVHKTLSEQIAAMRALVVRANQLAGPDQLRMEDGTAELVRIVPDCAALAEVAKQQTEYASERAEAEQKLKALEKQPGAATIAEQIATIKGWLEQARLSTDAVDSKGEDWKEARSLVKQAVAEIAAAETMLASMAEAVAAKSDADAAGTSEEIALAVAKLREQAKAAQQLPHADIAEEIYQHLFASLEEAERLGPDQPKVAAVPLQGAGDLLIQARTAQAEHGRFVDARAVLQGRVDGLGKLTDPAAATIQGKIDPITVALTKADEFDAAGEWGKAGEALRAASVAADEADQIAALRSTFDGRAEKIDDRIIKIAEPTKTNVAAMLQKATEAANAFNLDHANRFLDNAEAQIAGENVKRLARKPDDPAFLQAIEKMLAAAGGEELLARPTDNPAQPRNAPATQGKKLPSGPELLDQIVKNFGDDVPARTIALIAKKRFGIDLHVSVILPNGSGGMREEIIDDPESDERLDPNSPNYDPDYVKLVKTFQEKKGHASLSKRSETARKLYDTLALTPEQVKGNPSLKRVERKDAITLDSGGNKTDISSGGYYTGAGNKTVMSGRPGDNFQKFGTGLNTMPGLDPQLIDFPPKPWTDEQMKEFGPLEVYLPSDESEVDYFEFANVHETGHSVDDRLGFMRKREGVAEFGGWKTYGGNIGPIVDAVAGKYAKGFEDAVKEFITDLMTNNNPATPTVAPDQQAAMDDACDKIRNEWHANACLAACAWWSRTKSDAITIGGVVYHEAYEGSWVSYLASERKKALTGYQFRAPGEWFAELYAAYHTEKLKRGHPARQWLSSLAL